MRFLFEKVSIGTRTGVKKKMHKLVLLAMEEFSLLGDNSVIPIGRCRQ